MVGVDKRWCTCKKQGGVIHVSFGWQGDDTSI